MQKYQLQEEQDWLDMESKYVPFTRKEYEQALHRMVHPRHKEAMILRASKGYDRIVPYEMSKREALYLEKYYEPKHLNQ